MNALRRRARAAFKYWMAHRILQIAALAIGIVGVVLIAAFGPTQPDPAHPRQDELTGWATGAVVVLASLSVLGLVSLIEGSKSRDRQKRIERLTAALDESMRVIAQINSEMAEGRERLAELERQTNVNEELAKLSGKEAAAVRSALSGELALERRRSLWRDLLMVLLGAALSYMATRFL
jgi:hypothetical protein